MIMGFWLLEQPKPHDHPCPARVRARAVSLGGEGVAQVRYDVADGYLDGLTGGARGDLDRAVRETALAHGHPEWDPGELGVAELHPGPFGPVVDDDLDP